MNRINEHQTVVLRRLAVAAAVAVSALSVSNVGAHGTIVDSRVYRVRQAGPNANLMGAWTNGMYDWAANSQNFADYDAPNFSYATYVPDGTIASAGQNNGTNGHLDFSALNTPGAWPTTPAVAGASLHQTWTAPAPHNPSYFDVWITKPGFDVTTQTLGWGNLDKLGRWEAGTSLNVTTSSGSAPSPADSSLLTGYNWDIPIAANRSGRAALVVVWQRRDPVGEAFFSVQDILIAAPTPAGATWIPAGGGAYATAANWTGGVVPNAAGAVANFGSSITGPASISLGSSVTVGALRFDNANTYTVSGNGTMMLEGSGGSATIDVVQGGHAINAGVMLHDSTVATVAAGSSLSLGGSLMFSSNNIFTKAGAGTLSINSPSVMGASNAMFVVDDGKLQIDKPLSPRIGVFAQGGEARFAASQRIAGLSMSTANGKVSIASEPASPIVLQVSSIGIGTGSRLDIGDNVLIVDYSPGNSMLAAMIGAAQVGIAGNQTGAGLVSSSAATNARMGVGIVEASSIGSPASFLGTSIDSTSVIARFTFKGDADLNGSVNFDDLLSLAQSYNHAGSWRNGDSDHSGFVDFADLLAIAQNYNNAMAVSGSDLVQLGGASFASDWALALSMVPEPTSVATLLCGATLIRRRAR